MRSSIAGFATAALAIACCASLPALAALIGGVTLVAVLGLAGAALALTALAVFAYARARRRRHE